MISYYWYCKQGKLPMEKNCDLNHHCEIFTPICKLSFIDGFLLLIAYTSNNWGMKNV